MDLGKFVIGMRFWREDAYSRPLKDDVWWRMIVTKLNRINFISEIFGTEGEKVF